jgi:hypothetical protein
MRLFMTSSVAASDPAAREIAISRWRPCSCLAVRSFAERTELCRHNSLSPMSLTFANISTKFPKKIETVLLGYLGARGELIHEKNLKLKITCQTPFKSIYNPFLLPLGVTRDGDLNAGWPLWPSFSPSSPGSGASSSWPL